MVPMDCGQKRQMGMPVPLSKDSLTCTRSTGRHNSSKTFSMVLTATMGQKTRTELRSAGYIKTTRDKSISRRSQVLPFLFWMYPKAVQALLIFLLRRTQYRMGSELLQTVIFPQQGIHPMGTQALPSITWKPSNFTLYG